jgi:integrase
VSYAALEDWSHWLADRGLSPKTRWNILAAFRSFLGWLYRREEIRELPREYPWPKPPERTPAPLSARTQDEILDAIPEERRGIYLAMALMGLRPGEAVALDVADGALSPRKTRTPRSEGLSPEPALARRADQPGTRW